MLTFSCEYKYSYYYFAILIVLIDKKFSQVLIRISSSYNFWRTESKYMRENVLSH